MHIELTFPTDAEAKVEGVTATGQKVQLKSIKITPRFWLVDSAPHVVFFESRDLQDEPIRKGIITLAGATGQVKIHDRTNPACRTRYETKKYGDEPLPDPEAGGRVGKKPMGKTMRRKKKKKKRPPTNEELLTEGPDDGT